MRLGPFAALAALVLAPAPAARAAAALPPASADVLSVALHASAEADPGAPLTLGALADVAGDGAERAAAIEIARAPEAGRRTLVTRGAVRKALEANGWTAQHVAYGGAAQLKLDARGQRLDPARVRAAIEAMLRANTHDADVTLGAIRVPDTAAADPGDYELRAELPQGGLRPGAVVVPLVATSARGGERRVPVTATLAMTSDVLVAVRDVARGERLEGGDVRVERRPIAAKGRYATDRAALARAVARAPLHEGQPIPASAIGASSAVEPGQRVTLLVRSGTVTLALDTVARGRGAVGAIVPVSGLDGHRVVRARVLAPGRLVALGSDDIPDISINANDTEEPGS